MSQARDTAIAEVLDELQAALPSSSAALVLRTGALFAGRVPPAVNREGFAAMAAVVMGAAETATADLGDEFVEVETVLRAGALVCLPAGKKMVLVVHLPQGDALEGARPRLRDAARRLGSLV